ncbi:hypothetical protein [Klebsiella pneumoniae]|uniref:hypothetical protein n=1 Tax=Klebsiella pneumoniae TaxID=573 RepID=UPI00351F2D6E
MELSRMALAALDSESGCLPLDYLQGHKDGLEWAAQLAEANHPETGDWLYDDPIELAKAIRKGPDMPPAQPAADSEPDRNPVLAYADSYRDMANQGVESVPIWSVITDLERNIAPLYRHAQPVPVVPDELNTRTANDVMNEHLSWKDYGDAEVFCIAWNACRAAMLQELQKSAGAEEICRSSENEQDMQDMQAGNSPVIGIDLASGPDRTVEVRYVAPPGYVVVPKEPTRQMLDEFDSIIDYGAEDSQDAWRRLLAAAPHEAINALIPLVSRDEQEGK